MSTEQKPDLFKSLPKEAFESLPRLSQEAIQKALDEGRPQPIEGAVWLRLESQRYL